MSIQDTHEYDRIKRRRELIQAMQERAMQPYQTQMVSGRAVPMHWGEGLSKIAQAYMAKKGLDKANADEEILNKEYNEGKMQTIADAMTKYKGLDQYGPQGPRQPVSSDPMGAAGDIMGSRYAGDLKSVSDAMLKQQVGGGKDYSTMTPGEKGALVFNTRTQNMEYKPYPEGFDGPIKYDPGVQAGLAGGKRDAQNISDLEYKPKIKYAETEAVKRAERAYGMEGINTLATRAREILAGDNKPTGSGVGAAIDYLGSLFGWSPDGANEAAALKAISGAMAGKMPRFEGPQSDYDREYYMDMAGRVGDATKPIDQRLEALNEVVSIWGQYDPATGIKLKSGAGAQGDTGEYADPEKERKYQEYKARQANQ